MRYLLQYLAAIFWALWLGGTISTFVFGWYLFKLRPDIAGSAASTLFLIFSRYQLVLAGLATLASGLLMVSFPTKRAVLFLATLVLAGCMSITFSLGLIPRMEMMRSQGKQQSDEFKKYHGKSMMVMMMQSGMLLLTARERDVALLPQPPEPPQSEYEPMFRQ